MRDVQVSDSSLLVEVVRRCLANAWLRFASRMRRITFLRHAEFLRLQLAFLVMLVVSGFGESDNVALLDGELNPSSVPRFVNPLTDLLHSSFVWRPSSKIFNGSPLYEIGVYKASVNVLGPGLPNTTIFGYGNAAHPVSQGPTYISRSFSVRRGEPTYVKWSNHLVSDGGKFVPHLFPFERTLAWADPLNDGLTNSTTYTGPVPVVTHVHGAAVEWQSDGLPDQWFTPGQAIKGPMWQKEIYNYDNEHEAAALWYHDHTHGITHLNVYAGLAGLFIIRDNLDTGMPDNPLGLPAYPYEVALAIQDRRFYQDGSLLYPKSHRPFLGHIMVINGKAFPYLRVQPRKYRFRVLNGCNDRLLKLSFSDPSLAWVHVGTDKGLRYDATPLVATAITISPGERFDAIVDFSVVGKGSVFLLNRATTSPDLDSKVLRIDVVLPFDFSRMDRELRLNPLKALKAADPFLPPPLPPPMLLDHFSSSRLQPLVTTSIGDTGSSTRKVDLFALLVCQTVVGGCAEIGAARIRRFGLFVTTDETNRHFHLMGPLDKGPLPFRAPVTEIAYVGDVEIWELINLSPYPHPMHIHNAAFAVLGYRQVPKDVSWPNVTFAEGSMWRPPPAWMGGPKDVVFVGKYKAARLLVQFNRPGHSLWHCHIPEHEDRDMMRPLLVYPRPDHPNR